MTAQTASTDDSPPGRMRPWLIGLVGGVASGKSTVARSLAQLGALWLDCDKIAHQVLELPDVIEALRERFSDQIIGEDGRVDRKRLAALVFGADPIAVERRSWLERLVHPRVRELAERRIAEAGMRYPAIIIDAPLLIEAGWADLCDRILLVDTPLEQRRRLAAARGWSAQELDKRERSQMPLDVKRQTATDILANDGSLAQLEARVQDFWQSLIVENAPEARRYQ